MGAAGFSGWALRQRWSAAKIARLLARVLRRGRAADAETQSSPVASRRVIGQQAEDEAARYLARHGLIILARNFSVPGGEIDLVCRDGAQTVFVEVRWRQSARYGSAADSIGPVKRRRIVLAARHWLQRHGETPCRFDCMLVDGGGFTWLRDAFSAD